MKKINSYGRRLQDDFCKKVNIQEDIDNETFDGTWRYEQYIETIEDAIGWMLETYDYEAIDVLDNWIEETHISYIWGLDVDIFREALKSVFE